MGHLRTGSQVLEILGHLSFGQAFLQEFSEFLFYCLAITGPNCLNFPPAIHQIQRG